MIPVRIVSAAGERVLRELPNPIDLDQVFSIQGPLEIEIGFGKGKYLRARAESEPTRRFLGLEIVSKYHRLLADRVRRRGLANLVVMRGEALYLTATSLPVACAEVVHVYFPDPWPKSRHHRRRLFDATTLDLLLRLLVPGGSLVFATDHVQYGEDVVAPLLAAHPSLAVERLDSWPEGPRTHYEGKYVREGRPIVRLVATLVGPPQIHPDAGAALTSAWDQRVPAPCDR